MARATTGASWVEAAAVGSFVLLVAGGLALLAGNWSTVDPDDVFGSAVLSWLITVGYGGVGTLLVLRLPGHRVSRMFLAVGWLLAAQQLLEETSLRLLVVDPGPRTVGVAAAIVAAFLGPAFLLVLSALVLVFPERSLSPAGRRLLLAGATCTALGGAIGALTAGPLFGARGVDLGVDNELGVIPTRIGAWSFLLGLAPVVVLLVAGAELVRRFHRSSGVERAQLSWPAYAAGLSLLVLLLSALPVPYVTDLHLLAGVAVAVGVPGGCLIGITRYRLFEIDRLISRTVSYALLTGVLLLAYVGVVSALNRLAPVDSQVGVAAATLAVAAAVQPLRRRLQDAVDRRFDRARYDATRTVAAFAQRLRAEVDLDTVCDDLRDVVSTSVQPTSVTLWLRPRAPLGDRSGSRPTVPGTTRPDVDAATAVRTSAAESRPRP